MSAKNSRRLVIDASVARSSGGEEATFPASKYCRDFLKSVLQICHHVVMTPEIREEWHKHQSNFARMWMTQMVARRKMRLIRDTARQDLREKISHVAENEKARAAMLKDIHLLEAAMASDKLVAALDETVRELFAAASTRVGEIKDIVWVNPAKEEETPIEWLEAGAGSEKGRRIGFQKKN